MNQPRRIVCSGSPYEMGVAQGSALKDSIRAMPAELRTLEAFRMQQPWWLPYPIYLRIAERKAESFLAQAMDEHHPAARERLEGISAGSGVSMSSLMLINVLESVLSSLGDCTASIGGCSALAVRRARSQLGSAVIAKNFDYLPLVQPYYVIRESRPAEGLVALEFAVASLAGTIDGVNERGLCITYDYAFTIDEPAEPAVPISILISEALKYCDTVDAAAEYIATRPRHGGGILMLADDSGDMASLELSSTRSHLRRPSDSDDVIFHTNSFFSEEMRRVQLPEDAQYTHRAPTPLRGRRVHQSSDTRDARMAELISGSKALGLTELQEIMSDHGSDQTPGDFTLCVHGSYWFTTASVQLISASRTLRTSFSTTCESEYTDFSLKPGRPE